MNRRAGRRVAMGVGAGVLVLLMAGCGLLWAPLEERDNPLDPQASATLELLPVVDGTVGAVAPINEGSLVASDFDYSVIRFDLSGLPATVTRATLRLQCSAVFVEQVIEVYPILLAWDKATLKTVDVEALGFLVSAPAADAYVDGLSSYDFDLTAAIASMDWGVTLKGTMSGAVHFFSSATAGQEPRLIVQGHD